MPGQSRLGIEYPTMIFLGTGTSGVLTTHEVAHQWFYGLVGDDQARDPVLDEGLATYAMGTLFQGVPVVGRLLRHTGEPMPFWARRRAADGHPVCPGAAAPFRHPTHAGVNRWWSGYWVGIPPVVTCG